MMFLSVQQTISSKLLINESDCVGGLFFFYLHAAVRCVRPSSEITDFELICMPNGMEKLGGGK